MKGMMFTTNSVQGIRADRKTMTRRVVKPQPPEYVGHITVGWGHPTVIDRWGDAQPGKKVFGAWSEYGEWGIKVPCRVGEVVYVKEALYEDRSDCSSTFGMAMYQADNEPVIIDDQIDLRGHMPWQWKRGVLPAMSMPEEAAREWLEITEVVCERVHEISEEDAKYVIANPFVFGYRFKKVRKP